MAGFLSAHGYAPGPTQRPYLAGAASGLVATMPAIALLHFFGTLRVEAQILGVSEPMTLAIGGAVMAAAGAVYARVFGRAANNNRGGWLFGMAFGFVLWMAGAVMILPLVSGGLAPAGIPAIGAFLALIAWGAAAGLLVPVLHRPLTGAISKGARLDEVGPAAAVAKDKNPIDQRRQ